MKFLLDMPVSPSLLNTLRDHGHEGVHAHQINHDRAPDTDLLKIARREDRIIITADLDYPRLLALSSDEGPGIILFRGGSYSDAQMRALLERVLTEIPAETIHAAICVVDLRRIRIARLPISRKPLP